MKINLKMQEDELKNCQMMTKFVQHGLHWVANLVVADEDTTKSGYLTKNEYWPPLFPFFQSYRYSGCTWGHPDGVLTDITSENKCIEACDEPGPCNYYQYNEDKKECYFYDYDNIPSPTCEKIIGPANDPNTYECLRSMEEWVT